VRALPTKSDRFFWFDTDRANGIYDNAFNAPMLWNSNFFMTPEAMKILQLLIDVWLPDFKFGPGQCAKALAGTPWYWENLRLIHEAGEDLTISPPGDAESRRMLHRARPGVDR